MTPLQLVRPMVGRKPTRLFAELGTMMLKLRQAIAGNATNSYDPHVSVPLVQNVRRIARTFSTYKAAAHRPTELVTALPAEEPHGLALKP
jgi:hypothetical protein